MYGPPASAAATATANGGGGFSSSGLGRKPTLGQKRGSIFGFLGLGGGYEQAKRDSQVRRSRSLMPSTEVLKRVVAPDLQRLSTYRLPFNSDNVRQPV